MKNLIVLRIVSLITDLFIVSMLYNIINAFIPLEFTVKESTMDYVVISYGYSAAILFVIAYFLAFALLNKSQTFGKIMMGITVCKVLTGRKLTRSENLVRTAYKIVSIVLLPFAAILFLLEKDSIQDVFTRTRTIMV